jgi:UDP-GlcNAc:undecaprenyl-phosphate GlcNAc-1-phosphate transferase
MIESLAIAGAALAFLLSLVGARLAGRVAWRLGFVDKPRDDRFHRAPTPLLGGSAILLAILLPGLLVLAVASVWNATGIPAWAPEAARVHIPGIAMKASLGVWIFAGAIALHIVGLVDDRKNLGPWLKLAAMLAVAGAVVIAGNVRLLTMLGEPWSSIASIVWIVVVINAFNFLDNMDGLSAGVATICGAALLGAAAGSGQLFVAGFLCLFVGATAGFLTQNFPPAKIFMGDCGSLVLGYFLGIMSILTTYYHGGAAGVYFAVFVPVVLLAVPLYDTVSVIVLRVRLRLNPMIGDTRHFSHRLLRRGMSQRKAVLTIYLATAVTAVGASLLPHVTATGAIMVFAQTIGIVLIIALLESSDGTK